MDYNPSSPGIFDPVFSDIVLLPKISDPTYLDSINKLAEKIDILIPNLDEEVVFLAAHSDELREMGLKFLLPRDNVVEKVKDKVSLEIFLSEERIDHPDGIVVGTNERVSWKKYPAIVKSPYGAFCCMDEHELEIALRRLRNLGEREAVVQEYIEGDEYSFTALSLEGSIVGLVMQRKLALSDIGSTIMGISVRNERVLEVSKDVLKKVTWDGPVELEFRISGDKVLLTDFNLRFPAWIRLAPYTGVNLPYILVNLILGRPYEVREPRSGAVIVRFLDDRLIDVNQLNSFLSHQIYI